MSPARHKLGHDDVTPPASPDRGSPQRTRPRGSDPRFRALNDAVQADTERMARTFAPQLQMHDEGLRGRITELVEASRRAQNIADQFRAYEPDWSELVTETPEFKVDNRQFELLEGIRSAVVGLASLQADAGGMLAVQVETQDKALHESEMLRKAMEAGQVESKKATSQIKWLTIALVGLTIVLVVLTVVLVVRGG